jgi:hypothetical protein
MVHWIYVLECDDDYIYVGETTRLFRRFDEHLKGRGGSNTTKHKPNKLIGLYKGNENYSFMIYRDTIQSGEYNRFIVDDWENDCYSNNYLHIENHITERYLYERRENDCYGGGSEWYKVRGGKYTREKMDETVAGYKWASEKDGRTFMSKNPIEDIPVDSIVDRPLCKCNYPSEVKLSKDKSKIYFVCSLKNVWKDFYSYLQIDTPCDFWKLYTEDSEVKLQYEVIKIRSNENWVLNIPYKTYSSDISCVSCNKFKYIEIFNRGKRRVCQSCMFTKYDYLKEKYINTYLITDT